MLLTLPFFLFVGIVLPLLGWVSLRNADNPGNDQDEGPAVQTIAVQLGILQALVGCLALLAVYGTKLELAWLSEFSPVTLLASFAALAGFLALALLEARKPLGRNDKLRARLREVSATDPAWMGVTLFAGVVEEFAYRGVLTLILAGLVGYWAAAIASALLFGLGHLSGGWRAAGASTAFALAMQTLVFLSGGLLLAVLVHAVYDLLAGWLGRRLAYRGSQGTSD